MKPFFIFHFSFFILLFVAACSDEETPYDPYYDWQTRNAQWFRDISNEANAAIAEAKTEYGDAWEEHCQWRKFKTLYQPQNYNTGNATDSICVRIAGPNTSEKALKLSPKWNDSIRVNYRGWLMPTIYKIENTNNVSVDSLMQEVFDQSYYGDFDAATAAPSLSATSTFIEGFNTALQYMVEGDDWYVYIPQELAYGSNTSGKIPAYSTLLFRIHLAAVYPCNSGVPTWKVNKK